MLKRSGLTTVQWTLLVAGFLTVLLVPLMVDALLGQGAVIAAVSLAALFVGFLVLEARHYQLLLFEELLSEARRQFSQVDALLSIHRTLEGGMPLPPSRGWAASPDLMREVLRMVLKQRPKVVLEVSSGTSTVILAYALERIGAGHVYALEHELHYAERTRCYLQEHGLAHRATVVHAPLVEQPLEGGDVRWYDLRALDLPGGIDFMLVDGPPDTTGPMARYPAVPLLRAHFAARTTVVLDDGGRADETRTAERWARSDGASTPEFLALEKGAWVLRFAKPEG